MKGFVVHPGFAPAHSVQRRRPASLMLCGKLSEGREIDPSPGSPRPANGRVAIREVINGVMYILSAGWWRALQGPPRSTVHDYLETWDGNSHPSCLYLKCQEKAAREASPTAFIDSQSVKRKKGGSQQPRLRCRQADQGQEAACSGRYARLAAARHRHPPTFRIATAVSRCWRPCSVVRRQRLSGPGLSPRPGRHPARSRDRDRQASDRVKGFVVQPRRWVVERTIAWLNRCRRLAKDWENLNRTIRSENSVIHKTLTAPRLAAFQPVGGQPGANMMAKCPSGMSRIRLSAMKS